MSLVEHFAEALRAMHYAEAIDLASEQCRADIVDALLHHAVGLSIRYRDNDEILATACNLHTMIDAYTDANPASAGKAFLLAAVMVLAPELRPVFGEIVERLQRVIGDQKRVRKAGVN